LTDTIESLEGTMSTEVCDLSAVEQAGLLRRREISARELLSAHLTRIEAGNKQVNAIVTLVAEQAMDEAVLADKRLVAGQPVGALHGLVAAHKDTHNTAGIRTTFGSPLLRDNVPDADELVISRMKEAGAITVGKTNVPEFGGGSHTFNPLFGATRNPYNLERSAGGSSGGAAAALATGMASIADGSDMGGSLRNPASFCNVVGLRPSPGRVPSYPNLAAWSTMLVQGPMGRTVEDVALLLSVQAGDDPRSPIALGGDGSEYTASLERDLTGLRVAWSPDLGGAVPVDSAVTDTLAPQVKVFESLGCVVEETCPDFSGAEEVFRTLRAWQFELQLGSLLDTAPDRLKSSLVWNIEEGRRLTGSDLGRAERLHTELYHRMRLFFEDYDVLLLPVSQVVPFEVDTEYPLEINGIQQQSYLDWMRSAYFVSAAGNPALSVPGGFTPDGLPVGLQIVGRHRGETELLQVGHAFEKATAFGSRRPPRLYQPPRTQP
jgi:amidase